MIFGTLLLMENAKNKRLPNPRKPLIHWLFRRATDGARTRDHHLGKVAYYQLYYCRIFLSLMYLSDESYNNTVSSAWQAFL